MPGGRTGNRRKQLSSDDRRLDIGPVRRMRRTAPEILRISSYSGRPHLTAWVSWPNPALSSIFPQAQPGSDKGVMRLCPRRTPVLHNRQKGRNTLGQELGGIEKVLIGDRGPRTGPGAIVTMDTMSDGGLTPCVLVYESNHASIPSRESK